ncbi:MULTISPECIES: LCP family protein [Lysinibacillus]|jgi:LCP family protein required for cell wall assembly|uniref:Regulatory protein MsrR n=1 Tax=Lysinibacillus fusiformis TaxID=28031 RepID=A0A2I0V371_9BACI|nr:MULTISPECIES: LCP family protein [Lysinibacillus]KUF29312.1 transcriptional regulator [Lysinibacillus sp. F5]MEE3808754.1 LCP family protein [Lysinibacillus fusiformis]PKU52754.1 LytR family transcriptional regulator [Lysinibacillus fusiformis]WCH49284.1 LCP family protein [Lysinibacillus sp. OF-1]SCY58955.1 transcriptional attenuator, LytR family [Lysinibacillus sp. SG9]
MKHSKTSRRWLRNSFLAFALIISIGIVYWIYQYNSGLAMAEDDINKEDEETFEPFKGVDPQFGEINVLLIGSDSRGDEGRSDALMIAHYNQTTNNVKIVSIMRDTYVDIPDYGMNKINAAFAFGGPELVRKSIKQNFDIDVNYYAIVDFEGFPKIVDLLAPNGIEVDIPYEMSYGIGMTLFPGEQTLHGDQLLAYVRFRHDRLSDFGRVERQQEVMTKVKEQISFQSLINLPKILGVAEAYIDTNIDNKTILAIGKGLIDGKSNGVDTLRIPVASSFDNKHVNVGAVLDIDLEKNKSALEEFLSSEDNVQVTKLEGVSS